MARMIDANVLFSGQEPKFSGELSQINLMRTLSWYAQNKDNKDSYKYACDFMKKNHKLDVSSVIKNQSPTFGFVCRILSNGGTLPEKNLIWVNEEIEKLKDLIKNKKEPVIDIEEPVVKVAVPNIQDRLREKASECVGELEGQLDDLIISKFSADLSPYGLMHGMEIKGVHTKHISEWFKKRRIEFDEVLHTDDPQIKEGYSNFTKPQLKKLIAWCDQVITDCTKISGEAVKSRKPRKRKTKTPEQLVAKVKVLDKFDELKLVSIPTKEIIGAMQLWVYNTKTRKLGCYHAIDADGLSVKGSSLSNFNESKSVSKTLRKPEATLPDVVKGGKVLLRNYMDGIKAVATGLTGRLNADTILIRTLK